MDKTVADSRITEKESGATFNAEVSWRLKLLSSTRFIEIGQEGYSIPFLTWTPSLIDSSLQLPFCCWMAPVVRNFFPLLNQNLSPPNTHQYVPVSLMEQILFLLGDKMVELECYCWHLMQGWREPLTSSYAFHQLAYGLRVLTSVRLSPGKRCLWLRSHPLPRPGSRPTSCLLSHLQLLLTWLSAVSI